MKNKITLLASAMFLVLVALCTMGNITVGPNTRGTIMNLVNGVYIKSSDGVGTNETFYGNTAFTNASGVFVTISGGSGVTHDFDYVFGGTAGFAQTITASRYRLANSSSDPIVDFDQDMRTAFYGSTYISNTLGVSSSATFGNTVFSITNIICQTFNLQTTGATPANIATIATVNNSVWNIFVNVVAANADYSKAGGYFRTYTVRNAAGTTTVVGAVRTIGTDNETDAGWDVTVTETDPNILITVTGATTTTINWTCTVQATRVQ